MRFEFFVAGLVLTFASIAEASDETMSKARRAAPQRPMISATHAFQINEDGPYVDPIISHRVTKGEDEGCTTIVNTDITGTASWDLMDDPDNTTLLFPLGACSIMTGFGWDLGLTTYGTSRLSDATIYLDGEDLDGIGLFLTPATGDTGPGSMQYSSGGILDFSDIGFPNIPMGADGNLHIQFFESFDDAPDAIDAVWEGPVLPGSPISMSTLTVAYRQGPDTLLGGICPPVVPGNCPPVVDVPTMSYPGLLSLIALLGSLGVFLVRRPLIR